METRVGGGRRKGGDVWDVATRCGCSCTDRSLGGAARLSRGPKPHLTHRQAEQTDSWMLSRQEAHLEKLSFGLFLPPELAVSGFWGQEENILGAFVRCNTLFSAAGTNKG